MPKKYITIALLIIIAISMCVAFYTSNEPRLKAFLNTISLGIVVSSIFYFIVVWVPAWQRRERIHRNILKHFESFKLSCISTFLIASNSQQYRTQEMLLNQQEFRRYFKVKVKVKVTDSQDRWDVVLNELNSNQYSLNEILLEIKYLREEIQYTLNNIDVHNDEVFDFLKRLSQYTLRLEGVKPEYDDIKELGGFLWEIFTGWSFVNGYKYNDYFDTMLKKI